MSSVDVGRTGRGRDLARALRLGSAPRTGSPPDAATQPPEEIAAIVCLTVRSFGGTVSAERRIGTEA